MENEKEDFENLSMDQIKDICYSICFRIYIARNITLNENSILEQLSRIDRLLRDKGNYN